MKREIIDENAERIRVEVLDNPEFYKKILTGIGLGYEKGIEDDDTLVENVEEALENDIEDIAEHFDWIEEDVESNPYIDWVYEQESIAQDRYYSGKYGE